MTGNDLLLELHRRKGIRDRLLTEQADTDLGIIRTERAIRLTEQARIILQTVATQTQDKLRFHIEDLCNKALAAVFDDPYTVKLIFEVKRGRTEAVVLLCKDGKEIDPLNATGGGVVDILAFALRVSLWRLQRPRTTPVLYLDEPFHFLSRELQPRASALLREMAQTLQMQIILVSHSPDLIEAADRVFGTTNRNGKSIVKEYP